MSHRSVFSPGLLFIVGVGTLSSAVHGGGDDPFADEVITFTQGVGGSTAYNIPASALGAPDRISGGCFSATDVVTPFSPAYCPEEIVSLGAGGELVLKFNTPVTDDPNNLYGIDLLVFGNTGLVDGDWPNGLVTGLISEGGTIEVSVDGSTWHEVPGREADGLWPTSAYNDVPAYAQAAGDQPSDFTRPVDPALTLDDVMGFGHAALVQVYRGSGGGAGIDLASVGLPSISYVRISVSPDSKFDSPEIDAVADVSPRLAGDANLDGVVNVADLLTVITAWGAVVPGGPPADFNLDGQINVSDLLTVITNWG